MPITHKIMSQPVSKIRILIVEDEAIVARDLEFQLDTLGYETVAATCYGEDAIVLAGQLRPDLVLMDIALAGALDGIGAAQKIRERYTLPVVFLTAFAADEVLHRAQMAEPFGYILKPFSERELATVLKMALYKHQAEIRLRETAQLNQTILDNLVDSVITIDEQGIMDSFNQAASILFGYTPDQVLGQNVTMLMAEPHRSHHGMYLDHYRQTGEARIIGLPRELEARRKDGSIFPMTLSVSRATRAGQTIFIGSIRDLSQRRNDENEIRRLAFYDALTGLPNRRLLMDHLKHALACSTRSGMHGAVMLLDLDHFKQLNDTLGHSVGDELLLQVSSRLQGCIRESDHLARLGGDEFVILLEDLSPLQHEAATLAETIAKKILAAISLPYFIGHQIYNGTTSIGIVLFMREDQVGGDLIKKADVAMYQAKSAGRNTAQFFDPVLQAIASAWLELKEDMVAGMARQEFELYYQVQINREGKCTGVEALIRWHHPKKGMVSPAEFIPMAEESGLILHLGQWVLETACAQLQEWHSFPARAHWTIAVNVSALQFADSKFVANVTHALHKAGADPRLLKLELTESMLADDLAGIIAKMDAVKALGVSFSLDDFGTGYSCLTYLKRLPLNQLKIDQSFVRDVLSDSHDATIVRTILALGHNLHLNVIAEGVETAEQRDFLLEIGCDAFQGYYFGKPLAANMLSDQHD